MPLVIDKSTPSCGGGRFGCWTCTVVQRDRSMEAMIDNGEDWMQPMLDFRIGLLLHKNRKKSLKLENTEEELAGLISLKLMRVETRRSLKNLTK